MSQRQPCPYCGNRSFEEENGILVCTSCGRQQESGLQVADDEPEFGTQGKIVRKKVEKTKVKVTKIYRGARAYKLYLQAWQHVLWRQAYALIHGPVDVPEELWSVVRDLWTLRLSKLVQRLDEKGAEGSDSNDGATDADTGGEQDDVERKKAFLSPRLWDTISLVYLGALLLHCPITLNQMYDLIRTEGVPFIRAIRHVPYEISRHLPPEYQLALDTITIPTAQELQHAIYHMLQTYNNDLGMSFPALNWRLILFDWIKHLGLPIEVYTAVKRLADLIKYDFTYQLSPKSTQSKDSQERQNPRRSPVAMAEIQLISLLVIATKLLFPFHLDNSFAYPPKGRPSLTFDWSTWHRIHKPCHNHDDPHSLNAPSSTQTSSTAPASTTITPGQHITITDKDILNLAPAELDTYMDWYERTWVTPETVLTEKKTDLESQILGMFPLAPPPSHSAQPVENAVAAVNTSSRNESIESIARRIQSEAIGQAQRRSDDVDDEDQEKPGSRYPGFANVADIEALTANKEENAVLYFHEKVAELACLELKGLLRAVRYTERKLERWIDDKRREEVFGAGDMIDEDEMDVS